MLANLLGKIVEFIGNGASSACLWLTWDEPECPDELL